MSDAEKLPTVSNVRTIIPEEKFVLPYPGKEAKFVHDCGDFEPFYSSGKANRELNFRSITRDSLLGEFSVLGYGDGKISISISFNRLILFNRNFNIDEVKKYFDSYGMEVNFLIFKSHFETSDRTQLRNMFNIITENNEIPSSHYEQVYDIIDKA
jgi:hypothetical protein